MWMNVQNPLRWEETGLYTPLLSSFLMAYYSWGQDGGPCRNFFLSCLWAYFTTILLFHPHPELPGKLLPQVSGNPPLLALALMPPSSLKPALAPSTPHYNTISLGTTCSSPPQMGQVPQTCPAVLSPLYLLWKQWMSFKGSQKEAKPPW